MNDERIRREESLASDVREPHRGRSAGDESRAPIESLRPERAGPRYEQASEPTRSVSCVARAARPRTRAQPLRAAFVSPPGAGAPAVRLRSTHSTTVRTSPAPPRPEPEATGA